MGASFDCRVYKHSDRAKIKASFEKEQEASLHESGRSYSGEIGMLGGNIRFLDLKLENEQAAENYISEHHDKWDAPMAVSFKGGANTKERLAKAEEIRLQTEQKHREVDKLAITLMRSQPFVECPQCHSKFNTTVIRETRCPFCRIVKKGKTAFDNEYLPVSLLNSEQQAQVDKAREEYNKLSAECKKAFEPVPNGEIWWVVGGWCSS